MKNIIPFLLLLLLISCNDDDTNVSSCDQKLIIDQNLYETAPRDEVVINSLEITGDCIEISYSAGGCDGDTWDVELIDSGVETIAQPSSRNLLFSLNDDEECEAFITKSISIDASEILLDGSSINLIFTNTNDTLFYQ